MKNRNGMSILCLAGLVTDYLPPLRRSKAMNRMWGITFGLVFGAGVVFAADLAPAEKTGLNVGEKAPEFKLKDQNGEERSLTTLLKDGNVALVFYRSASW